MCILKPLEETPMLSSELRKKDVHATAERDMML